MAQEIIMPQMGLTMTQGKVVRWLKSEGDSVYKGEPVVEIESDKAVFECDSPGDGVLLKIVISEGETVPVATVIGYIGQAGETISDGILEGKEENEKVTSTWEVKEKGKKESGSREKEGQEERGRILISPRAKRIAQQYGLTEEELYNITDSGPQGRLTERDINSYIEKNKTKFTPLARKVAEEYGVELLDIQGTGIGGKVIKQDVLDNIRANEKVIQTTSEMQTLKVIPLEGIRKIVADRMIYSVLTSPHVTLTTEVDMTDMIELRKKINTSVKSDYKVSITDILVKVCALALGKHPEANAYIKNNVINALANVNIGIAVATDRGLLVPVIKEANKKSLGQISIESKDLIQRARNNKLRPDEMTGGTFTITNLGMYGIDVFTPIINPPESAILGVGRMVQKPVVLDGQITIRTMMTLNLSFDHRVIDGAPAAMVLQTIKQIIEKPQNLKWTGKKKTTEIPN